MASTFNNQIERNRALVVVPETPLERGATFHSRVNKSFIPRKNFEMSKLFDFDVFNVIQWPPATMTSTDRGIVYFHWSHGYETEIRLLKPTVCEPSPRAAIQSTLAEPASGHPVNFSMTVRLLFISSILLLGAGVLVSADAFAHGSPAARTTSLMLFGLFAITSLGWHEGARREAGTAR